MNPPRIPRKFLVPLGKEQWDTLSVDQFGSRRPTEKATILLSSPGLQSLLLKDVSCNFTFSELFHVFCSARGLDPELDFSFENGDVDSWGNPKRDVGMRRECILWTWNVGELVIVFSNIGSV